MLRHVLAIALKELRVLWHDRPALALLFVMPAFFITVMSYALQDVFTAGSKVRPLQLLLVDQDAGRLGAELGATLRAIEGLEVVVTDEGGPLTGAEAEELVRTQRYPLAVIVQPEFSARVHDPAAAGIVVSGVVDPATSEQLLAPLRGMIAGALQRLVIQARLPRQIGEAVSDLLRPAAGGDPLGGDVVREIEAGVTQRLASASAEQPITLTTKFPAGMAPARTPTATEQSVPAYTIFGVFFIALPLASSFVRERIDGTAVRLRVAPVSRIALLAGKLAPYYLVNLAQIGLMFAVGRALFGLLIGNLAALALVSLALAAAATGLGLMIASLGRTEAQVGALAVLASIALSALGGLMVPAFVMPGPMRTVALCTPHAWGLAAYHDVMLRGQGIFDVVPEAGVLLVFALGFFVVAVSRHRWD